jgi:putative ABC transport system substrate-binding protein
MDRRTFLTGTGAVLLATPRAAEAQPTKKVWRIRYLSPSGPPANLAVKGPLRQGLHDLGYIEGRDFVMEERWAEGHANRLPELTADLVRRHVDVIVTSGTPATMAAKQATQAIPIVFAVAGSVVEKGIVRSLAQPGGNVTGLQLQADHSKVLQLLKDAVPSVSKVAYLYDPASLPGDALGTTLKLMHSAAQAQNVTLQPVAVSDPNDVPKAFAAFGRGRNGLMLHTTTVLTMTAKQICTLALERRLAATGHGRVFADAKTAKALGLTIPPSLLGRADEVIQ